MVFSEAKSSAQDGLLEASQILLCEQDDFSDKAVVFPLPSTILTAAFVSGFSAEAKALVSNLRMPNPQLLAIQGDYKGMHIFDKASMVWLTCARFENA